MNMTTTSLMKRKRRQKLFIQHRTATSTRQHQQLYSPNTDLTRQMLHTSFLLFKTVNGTAPSWKVKKRQCMRWRLDDNCLQKIHSRSLTCFACFVDCTSLFRIWPTISDRKSVV